MDNKGFAESKTVEQDRIVEIDERAFSELMTVPMLKAFLAEKIDIARRQVEAVNQKLAGGLVVPDEFRNEAEIKAAINVSRYSGGTDRGKYSVFKADYRKRGQQETGRQGQ